MVDRASGACNPALIRFNARTMPVGELSHTITIAAGDTVAEFVPAANMVCVSLRVGGAELLDQGQGVKAYAEHGKTMGVPLLYPWANRLDRRGYEAAGKRVTLPESDGRYAIDPGGLPIHGALPGDLVWEVARATSDSVRAQLRWGSAKLLELFPFEHQLELEAVVSPGGLSIATTVLASGPEPVPVSFGFHPYLRLPAGQRETWHVHLGATQRLELDDRMIPTGERRPLAQRSFELADSSWDDGLAGLADPPVFAASADGQRLSVTFDEGFDWAQVYAPPGKEFICFEPMTAPTDALNSGEGLRVLEPGQRHRARFTVMLSKEA
ncbi:MAG: aldose 1-epimerase [Solirubrobacteraceae bacterium]